MEYWPEYTRFFTALFVILDPFAAIPIFLGLTHHYSSHERHRAVNIAAVTVLIVLMASALFGDAILTGLGTSLPSFRVGGGTVLLLMALTMLRSETAKMLPTQEQPLAANIRENIAVVPIAIPLLAGPGSISTVIIEVHRSGSTFHIFWVLAVICLMCLSLWLILRLATPIGRVLGPIGLNILNRLFGLILCAIAVEIMANGLRELFPGLAG
ncbi:MAG: NAAT family transporter [Gammaproteobacteria bacterium]|nr:NAAT family transporter [Gammaproteobacteria bacterium]